jgi:hypothetical protein
MVVHFIVVNVPVVVHSVGIVSDVIDLLVVDGLLVNIGCLMMASHFGRFD